ncbi:MAG: phage head closure protein, partial [Clostridium sp.]
AKTIKSKSSEELLLGGKTDKIAKKLIIRTPKRFELTNDYRVLFKGQQYSIKDHNDIKDLGIYTEIYIERLT